MERFEIAIPEEIDELSYFGDLHYGHPNAALPQAIEVRDRIIELEQPAVVMGDLIEGREPGHKYYIPGSPTVQEQKHWAIEFLEPLADEGLLLGILAGNHEEGIHDLSSLDPTEDICDALDVNYLRNMALLKVNHRGYSYKILVAHGSGGSTTPNGASTKIRNYSRSYPVDLIVWGHTHQCWSQPDVYVEFDDDLDHTDVNRQVAYAGTFLKSYIWEQSSYAERKNYNPTSLGYIYFEMDEGILQPRSHFVKHKK